MGPISSSESALTVMRTSVPSSGGPTVPGSGSSSARAAVMMSVSVMP